MMVKKSLIAGISAAALMLPAAAIAQEKPATDMTAATAQIDFIAKQQQNEYLASDLMDVEVQNSAGEELGDVNDLVVTGEGNVVGVVVGVGGFLGIGEKNVAVPYDTLEMTTREEEAIAVLNTTREQLESAPDYRNVENKPLSVSKRITDTARETYNQATEQASETYNEAEESINEAAGQVESEAEEAAAETEETMEQTENMAENQDGVEVEVETQ